MKMSSCGTSQKNSNTPGNSSSKIGEAASKSKEVPSKSEEVPSKIKEVPSKFEEIQTKKTSTKEIKFYLCIFLIGILTYYGLYLKIKREIPKECLTGDQIRDYYSKEAIQEEIRLFLRSQNGRKELSRILRIIELEEVEERLSARRKRASISSSENLLNARDDGPHVEFFDPKLKGDLQAKDELQRQKTGSKGAAPGGDNWVWLTSYSRIPVSHLL